MRGRRIGHSIRTLIAFSLIAVVGGVTGCSETQLAAHVMKSVAPPPSPVTGGKYKVGEPYQVNGKTYYPQVDPTYNRTGVASWYGADFHGKQTANGDTYNMNALTAAHTTLPMPSKVRVTNLENGRTLILTVNDRGPFVKNRIIDVSRRAAQLLGFAEQGTAQVRVEAIGHHSNPNIQTAALSQSDGSGGAPTFPPGGATKPVGPDPVADVSMQPTLPPPGAKLSKKAAAMVRPMLAQESPPIANAAVATATPAVAPAAKPVAETAAAAPVAAPAAMPVAITAAPAPAVAPVVQPAAVTAAPSPAPAAATVPKPVPVAATAPATPVSRAMYVQGGAFRNQDNARALQRAFVQFGPTEIEPATVDGKTFYRVRLGPVYDPAHAKDLLSQIVDAGHDYARLVVE